MKHLTLLALTLCLCIPLHGAEASDVPTFYAEFCGLMSITKRLHTLVNQTDIDVKAATNLKDKNLIFSCHHEWNTTDQGLVAYFEHEHLTTVYSPFGRWMVFWATKKDKKWDSVLTKFKETCTLDESPFAKRGFEFRNTCQVTSIDNKTLPITSEIMQGNQKRRKLLDACIAKYLNDGGTLIELETLGKRKKRLQAQERAREANPTLTIPDIFLIALDIIS